MVRKQGMSVGFVAAALVASSVVPAGALGAAGGTDRPVQGKSLELASIDLATGLGTGDGHGKLSHLGKFTFHDDFTSFTFTGPSSFLISGTETIVAANGDRLFADVESVGAITSTGLVATTTETITGGTGRFAEASGVITRHETDTGRTQTGSVVTTNLSNTSEGTISY
jgi:hypothetical protein